MIQEGCLFDKFAVIHSVHYCDLRHSCATLMITRGIHPRVVMEVLGHSQISTTMNTYAHVFANVQREAVNELDKLLEEQTTDTDSNPIKDDPEVSSQDDTNP